MTFYNYPKQQWQHRSSSAMISRASLVTWYSMEFCPERVKPIFPIHFRHLPCLTSQSLNKRFTDSGDSEVWMGPIQSGADGLGL